MKKTARLLASMGLLATSSAYAQATGSTGWYISADAAYIKPKVSAFNVEDDEIKSEIKDSASARLGLGYQLSPNWSLELGGSFFQKTKWNFTDKTDNYSDTVKIKTQMADLSAIYRFTSVLPGLYLKGGITYAKLSMNVPVEELTFDSDGSLVNYYKTHEYFSTSGTGYLFGLGYELPVSDNLSLRAGYTRYQRVAGQNDVKFDAYSLGLKYRF